MRANATHARSTMARYRKSAYKQKRATQAALLVAAAAVPNSFQETLMPRSTSDQGLVTGLTMGINFEIISAIRKIVEDSAEELSGNANKRKKSRRDHKKQRRFAFGLDLLLLTVSMFGEKKLAQQPDETTVRSIMRTGATWAKYAAFAGLSVTALQEIFDGATGDKDESDFPVGVIGGAMAASYTEYQRRKSVKLAGGQKLHDNDADTLKAIGMGLGVIGVLSAVSTGQRKFADLLADEMQHILPDTEDFWWTAGHATAIAGTGLGIALLMRKVYHNIEEVATKIEPGYLKKPASTYVSGSAASMVPWKTLSIQGRRFVSSALTTDQITQTMDVAKALQPIRIFVGLDSAKTEEQRLALALEELERTNAFKRKTIMLISPTGTGYVNYVAVEAAEYMSQGDIASIALQYSKRPSPMSLDRVPEGRMQFKMLLKAITTHLETIPKSERPQLVLFGESLGAWTSQDAFIDQGTDGLKYAGVEKALWIGTPYGSKWKTQVLNHKTRPDVEPELVGTFNSIADLKALPKTKQNNLRYVMITHHNDAVTLFGASLLFQKPDWLTDPAKRPPTVSKSQYYTSPGTFLLTLMDMKNSMNVIPGQFEASGHDYRADLAEFIKATYGFRVTEAQMKNIEAALRANEVLRAERLGSKIDEPTS
jgi:uncharacterized membrane protein